MKKDIEKLELWLLFEAMYRLYGYDFRHYSYASARRRILLQLQQKKLSCMADLQHLVIHNEQAADDLLSAMSINVTEMFRDPEFFKLIRHQVLPQLLTHSHLKVWHAGCSSGEEVYSMSILLNELKLLKQTQLYATDFNNEIIEKAKLGSFNLKNMRQHIQQYHQAGGEEEFSQYYSVKNNEATITSALKKQIMFSHHNLTEDGSFGEMNIIVCRNVLIYFNKELQNRVIRLFYDSLCDGGYLCLGSHESLLFSDVEDQFTTLSATHKIYRKNSQATKLD